ncbi:LPXTG cell wall anchor domain-containing protein [Enterococcus villorum]|uniref:Gram-positive cocci surface proteins LPxTG domain-containing protein n=2 Tax=Enterococcus villorum TaxID=112904 RepID=A0A511IYU0_9ENTE|nr:LPXTG cell wall anchor domain-containing protein [Enterococcus villorum]EOH87535.1 LPXTG-domain-containing protein cell wall anchor domain [Enterococcus villorum ATCC 700913]EOW77746.1 hypothetical protein I591_00600 [Enterococcus villorum ATCC 700913]GEL90921.1 hypothetical protein EVI01_02580 [Enterococcus villorum]
MKKITKVFFLFLMTVFAIDAFIGSTTIYATSAQSSVGIRFVPGRSTTTSKQEVTKNNENYSKNNKPEKFPKTNDQQKISFSIIGVLVMISGGSFFLLKKGKKDKREKSSFNSCTF